MDMMIRAGLGALAISMLAVPAAAVSFVNAGDTATVFFNGIVDEAVQPGLTSKLDLTFDGYVGNNAKFSYTLTNTSGTPISNSRVSIFGFDVVNTAFNYATSSETSSVFTKRVGSFPQTLGGAREICFSAGPNCTGGGGGGVAYNGSESATFTLGFSSLQSLVELNNLIVRYQSIEGSDLGSSGIGIEYTPTGGVPEPATWAMLIAGFGLVGASMRRRRGTMVQVSA